MMTFIYIHMNNLYKIYFNLNKSKSCSIYFMEIPQKLIFKASQDISLR